MQPLVVIPARLNSGRLPNKMLADLGGVPLIVRTWQAAVKAEVGPVAVACADKALVEAIEQADGTAVLTDPNLPSGSDRVWAAAQALDPDGQHEWIINLQGDTPFFSRCLFAPFGGKPVARQDRSGDSLCAHRPRADKRHRSCKSGGGIC